MVESILWADIAKVSLMSGIAFILCGDFLQFPAVCEHWAGCAVPEGALERSHMLRDLVDGNRLTLTENKRSDQVLYQLYTSLQRRTLADALEEARARFPVTTRPATTIVISHARRRFLNMKHNLKDKPAAGAIFFKAPMTGGKTGPQSFWLWPGVRVIGAGGGPVKKGIFESVATVSEEGVILHSGVSLTAHQTVRTLRLSYALTYASCQGLTLPGVVRLDCTNSPHFSIRHLYVGSSRCTASHLLEVV